MRSTTRLAVTALIVTTLVPLSWLSFATAGASAATAASSSTTAGAPTLPQAAAADAAANWLADQVTPGGYLTDVTSSGGTAVDLSDTAQAVLALAATGNHPAVARRMLTYLSHHVARYISGGDLPGEVATLILDATSLHQSARDFGGTNLVTRLLDSMQTKGANAGMFGGTKSAEYDGAYRQGLALAALAAADIKGAAVAPAVKWLQDQQCAIGGWMALRSSTSTPCPASSTTTYSGPDSNSTALAVEGLVAQGAGFQSPANFFLKHQGSNAGWGYYGPPSDPDSTALVVQALLADHTAVGTGSVVRGAKDPVSALLSYRVAHGAFTYPDTHNVPSLLATEQAIPALMRKALPF